MVENWFEIVAAQLASEPLGIILIVGSGGSKLADKIPRGTARKVIWTEPDPKIAVSRQRQNAQDACVTILPVAMAATSGVVTLRQFNLSQATSLRAPTGLKTLFPGLLEIGQVEVRAQTAKVVLESVDFDENAKHVLILGAPGEEIDLISQLSDIGVLQRFTHVIVPLPALSLYEGAADGKTIRRRLEMAGFRFESRDTSDPDIPFAHLRLDTDILALITERENLQQGRDVATTEVERLKTVRDQVSKARDAATARVSALETELATLRETLETTQTERENLRQGRDVATAEIARLKTVRDQIAEARAEAEAKVAALQQDKTVADENNVALRKSLEEAERAVQTEHCEMERIRVLSATYRHAIRLELQRPTRRPDQTRNVSSVALQFIEALDGATADRNAQSLDTPAFKLDVFKRASEDAATNAANHVVLDVKSVPRSGLHYMKRQFAHLLQDKFSFCEWYQEPGCCKRMPCTLVRPENGTAYGASLRMLKSHDFDLTDPVYPVTPGMQRIILTRDPLYVLTSHWLLHLLGANKEILKAKDLRFEKIVYLHEPAILAQAYQILDNAETIPSDQDFEAWLAKQQSYMTSFSEKWSAATEMPRTYIVPYEKTPLAIEACLAPVRDAMSEDQRSRLEEYIVKRETGFQARQDPFEGPTPFLTELLQHRAALFHDAAEAVRSGDNGGLFKIYQT